MQSDRSLTDASLDRLVDGELGPDEERRVLASLDGVPGGWRRCALAFIEGRTWRREISAAAGQLTDPTGGRSFLGNPIEPCVRARPATSPRRRLWPHLNPPVVLAACVLVAFAAGWLVHDRRQPPTEPFTPALIARGFSENPNASRREVESQQPQWPTVMDPSDVITLVVGNPDGSTRSVLVPLLDAQQASRLAGGVTEAGIRPALPDPVRRQLERAGFRVLQERRYAPVSLEGRRMIVPIEDTQIVPVQYRVY